MLIKKVVPFLIGICFLILLTQCNTEIKEIVPDTELKITVLDAQGQPIPGALVGVFTSESAYRNANKTFSLNGAIQVDTADAKGLVEFYFTDVTQAPFYWLAGYKTDSSTYTNARIMHDNDVSGFRILRALNPSSVTYGSIILTPAEALLSFYSNTSSISAFPISVKLGNDTLSRLRSGLGEAPNTHFAPELSTVKVRRGVYPYQLINSEGCTYISQLEVKGGEPNLFIQSNLCTSGRVQFWTETSNSSVLPITITLDVNNVIGSVTTTSALVPECGAASGLTYFLDPGIYTYQATSFQGNCLWTGSFEIKTNECTNVNLSRCF